MHLISHTYIEQTMENISFKYFRCAFPFSLTLIFPKTISPQSNHLSRIDLNYMSKTLYSSNHFWFKGCKGSYILNKFIVVLHFPFTGEEISRKKGSYNGKNGTHEAYIEFIKSSTKRDRKNKVLISQFNSEENFVWKQLNDSDLVFCGI